MQWRLEVRVLPAPPFNTHMKLNAKRIDTILRRHDQLQDLAHSFVREKDYPGRTGEVRIDSEGISENVNTACNCHPEYEWVARASLEEFAKWAESKDM